MNDFEGWFENQRQEFPVNFCKGSLEAYVGGNIPRSKVGKCLTDGLDKLMKAWERIQSVGGNQYRITIYFLSNHTNGLRVEVRRSTNGRYLRN